MSKHYHLSRLAAPKTWPVKRKGIKWIAKPISGPHSTEYSMTIGTWLQEVLEIAKVKRDIKRILGQDEVLVNGKAVHELNFPVGIFDVLSIPKLKKHYRVLINNIGKLVLAEILEKDAKLVPAKVISKTTISGGKLQINCSNGWNLLAEKDSYSMGDVLFFDVEKRTPAKHIKLAKGNVVFLIGGKHVGSVARLEGIKEVGQLKKTKIVLLAADKEKWESSLNEVFIIGEKEPEIKVDYGTD